MARMATGLDTPGLLTYYGPTLLCMTLFEKGIDTLEWLLPANWTRKLSPETGADQEIGSEACCSDLLSVNQRRLSDDGRRDIVLGIETFTGLQSKVGPLTSVGRWQAVQLPSSCRQMALAGGPGGDGPGADVQYGMLVRIGGVEIHALRCPSNPIFPASRVLSQPLSMPALCLQITSTGQTIPTATPPSQSPALACSP